MVSIDERKLSLEEQRLELDIKKFTDDRTNRKKETKIKIFNPVLATIIVALIGFWSSMYATLKQNNNANDLEKRKFEFDLVKRGLELNEEERTKYFKLLYNYKLVVDLNLRVALDSLITHPEQAPNLNTTGEIDSKAIDTSSNIRVKSYRVGALKAARLEVGKLEDPQIPNGGPNVIKYMRGGVGFGWSTGFVSWCYSQNITHKPPFDYCYNYTYLLLQLKKNGWYKDSTYMPQPGDILIGNYPNDKLKHFGGIVDSVGNGFVMVIQGNTNNNGGPNGTGVFRKKTVLNTNLQFGHIPDNSNVH